MRGAAPAPFRLDSRFAAESRWLEDGVDLLGEIGPDSCAFMRGGHGFVTRGRAIEAAAHDVPRVLSDVTGDPLPGARGSGPIAVGALPFRSAGSATMVVPALTIGRAADGRCWSTTIRPGAVPHRPRRLPSPRSFAVSAKSTEDQWTHAITRALERIDSGAIEKVVLARLVEITADVSFDITAVMRRLAASNPQCHLYLAGGFVGASPELLVWRSGTHVVSKPMAGTIARSGGDDTELVHALETSRKDNAEHEFVVAGIHAVLDALCTEVAIQDHPEVVRLATVLHLATTVTGTLRTPPPSALDIALALHPTAAVGGTPTAAALDVIAEIEGAVGLDRGRYAGPVGWVDKAGDGEFAVALRGAEIDGRVARVIAGCGIVAGSTAAAEWAESEAKLQPMLSALVRP